MASDWAGRVDIVTAATDEPPADALLIRPDGHIAWAGADVAGLLEALSHWFGEAITA